jgi:hypothetical protein
VSILTIGLGEKIKKMQFFAITDLHFKDVMGFIFTSFLFFMIPESQQMTLHILMMVV